MTTMTTGVWIRAIAVGGLALAMAACATTPGVAPRVAEVAALIDRHHGIDHASDAVAAAACDAMLAALDPYSVRIPPAEWASYLESIEGHFGGIGLRVNEPRAGEPYVVRSVLAEMPAAAAGIVGGERLVAVDGRLCDGVPLAEFLRWLRGEPGSKVAIDLLAAGAMRRVELVRMRIEAPTVFGAVCEPDRRMRHRLPGTAVGYVRITSFTEPTAAEFARALAAARGEGCRALIVDLRTNGGGLAASAIALADQLLDGGEVVRFVGRDDEKRHVATPGGELELPLALLVGPQTASAAEVLAAALQDHRRAVVVGARSFGKGSAQRLFPLQHGGGLKLTVERWLRPSGGSIERRAGGDAERGGIWPDGGLAVELSPAEWESAVAELEALADAAEELATEPRPLLPADDPVVARAIAWLSLPKSG